jgi:hypothetical protein
MTKHPSTGFLYQVHGLCEEYQKCREIDFPRKATSVKPRLLLENKVFSTDSRGSFILRLYSYCSLVVEIEKCREIDSPRKATYGGTILYSTYWYCTWYTHQASRYSSKRLSAKFMLRARLIAEFPKPNFWSQNGRRSRSYTHTHTKFIHYTSHGSIFVLPS